MRGQGRAKEGASRGASGWGSEARGPGEHRWGRGRRGPGPRAQAPGARFAAALLVPREERLQV